MAPEYWRPASNPDEFSFDERPVSIYFTLFLFHFIWPSLGVCSIILTKSIGKGTMSYLITRARALNLLSASLVSFVFFFRIYNLDVQRVYGAERGRERGRWGDDVDDRRVRWPKVLWSRE